MNLQQRVDLLIELGDYMISTTEFDAPLVSWQNAKDRAYAENSWFIPEFIELSIRNISQHFLRKDKLEAWTSSYKLPPENKDPKNIGIVMAGNIPLVGFHDFLCVFLSGHCQTIKPSLKDQVLIKHLVSVLNHLNSETLHLISFAEMLQGCDAYIATGSNNSARYFDYYFARYPHLIRRNRTSIAILKGNESHEDLILLADDVFQYFGLGCRSVTKIFVPVGYNFIPLLNAFKKYQYFADHNKYRNNYDYQLTILIIDKKYYMTNGCILLTENQSNFSAIGVLHFTYYGNAPIDIIDYNKDEIQCIIGPGQNMGFGKSQRPEINDYADGVDTMQFLTSF